MSLSGNGYIWRGHSRVTLAFAVTVRRGRLQGVVRLRDSATHLNIAVTRLNRLGLLCGALWLDGSGRAGSRRVGVTVRVQALRHGTAVQVAIPAARYRLSGTFHGRLALRIARGSGTNRAG